MSAFGPELMADLVEYALDTLDAEARRRLDELLAHSPALRAELSALEDDLAAFGEAEIAPLEPTPSERARVLATIAAEVSPAPYARYVEALASCFDLGVEAMRGLLARLPAMSWTETGVPGVSFVHFEAGPRLAHADTGFVRFAPGAAFPAHRHHGKELTFVLEGRVALAEGRVLGPGESALLGPEDVHAVAAVGEGPVLYVTFHEGMEVLPSGEG